MKVNLDLINLTNDYNSSILLFGISFITLLGLNFASYKFQKDFSNINKPSKILIFFIASVIFIIFSLIILIFSNILFLNNNTETDIFKNNKNNINFINNKKSLKNHIINPSSLNNKINFNTDNDNHKNFDVNNDNYVLESSKNITIILLIIDIFVYLFIPLILFYLIEEKTFNESNSSNSQTNQNDYNNNNLDEAEFINFENNGINSVQNFPKEMDYMQIIKNYSFYITAIISLNVIYLILFKISILNETNILELYALVPEVIRIHSSFDSDIEILLYLNFIIIFVVAKFLLIIYLPFGLGKTISLIIDNLKNHQEINNEYNNLNSGFNKNYEVIKQITTQKLMTGKNLTKREKNLIRQCKENHTLLEHKQEVLEEKYSKFKVFLFYISFPLKFFGVILTFLMSFIFLISKIGNIVANFYKSECGIYCGYFTDKSISNITIQDIYSYILSNYKTVFSIKNNYFIVFSMVISYAFIVSNLMISLNSLGLFNLNKIFGMETLKLKFNFIKVSELRSDKIMSLLFYSIFFMLSLITLSEIVNLNPAISFYMENFNMCDYKLIEKSECKFSSYMLFIMKNSVNFSFAMLLNLIFDVVIVFLSSFFIILLPLKSLMNFVKNEEDNLIGC